MTVVHGWVSVVVVVGENDGRTRICGDESESCGESHARPQSAV